MLDSFFIFLVVITDERNHFIRVIPEKKSDNKIPQTSWGCLLDHYERLREAHLGCYFHEKILMFLFSQIHMAVERNSFFRGIAIFFTTELLVCHF